MDNRLPASILLLSISDRYWITGIQRSDIDLSKMLAGMFYPNKNVSIIHKNDHKMSFLLYNLQVLVCESGHAESGVRIPAMGNYLSETSVIIDT